MTSLEFSISIAHLYPDLLNIYGDLGNIVTLKNRAVWRGIEVKLTEIKAGMFINPSDFDIYFIGGGQDNQQILASRELLKNKQALIKAANSDAVFLAICGGYQLLGKYYAPFEGERLEGIGVLDAYTVAGKKRFIGNVVGHIPRDKAQAPAKKRETDPDEPPADYIYFGGGQNPLAGQTIVGFENHSGLTYINGETIPFLRVTKGWGNNGSDKTEGARFKNVFGTYLHGPILPKNPVFADYLLSLALKRKYKCEIPLKKLDDLIEENAHEYAEKHLK